MGRPRRGGTVIRPNQERVNETTSTADDDDTADDMSTTQDVTAAVKRPRTSNGRVPTRASTRQRTTIPRKKPIESNEQDEDDTEPENEENEDENESEEEDTQPRAKRTKVASRLSNLECPSCHKTFKTPAGLQYHVDHNVCQKASGSLPRHAGTETNDESKPKSKQYQRIRGKLSKRTCPNCQRVFTSSYGLSYHLNKKVCQPAVPSNASSEPPPLFPTLEPGLVFCTKYGVVQVVSDDRAVPTRTLEPSDSNDDPIAASAAAHLQRRLKVYYSACTKRDAHAHQQWCAVAVTSRARRALLQQPQQHPQHVAVQSANHVDARQSGSAVRATPLVDPSAPPESHPHRLVECIWVPDERVRIVVAASGSGTKGDVVLDGASTHAFTTTRPPRLFLQRRLLTHVYQATTVRYYCPHCWQCFLSRPGISYHSVGDKCRDKRDTTVAARLAQWTRIEQQAQQLVASVHAHPERFQLHATATSAAPKPATTTRSTQRLGPRTMWVEQETSTPAPNVTTSTRVPDATPVASATLVATVPMEIEKETAPNDETVVSPDDILAQLEAELYRAQGQMLGPMYTQVFKALGYRKPKPPSTRRRSRATVARTPVVTVLTPAVAPPLIAPYSHAPATTLEPPLPFMERTAPPTTTMATGVMVDVRALVQEVEAGRYPTIQRNNHGGIHDGYCAICKYQVPPLWMTVQPVAAPLPTLNRDTERPHQLISCDFCRRDVHLVCIRTRYLVKEPEPNEDFMCHHCISVIIQRRNRAEKRRQEKAASRQSHGAVATSESATTEAEAQVDLTKGVVVGSELECVAEQARRVGDLTELLRDAQSRLSIGMATLKMNQARRALLETSS